MFFNGIFSSERKAFVVRDTTQVSNVTALLTAGKSFSEEKNTKADRNSEYTNITIDGSNHLKFACLPR